MISLLMLIQKLQVQTSPHYSHSSLCPPAGSILRILRIVANIEPLPLPSPPAPLRKLWHKYFIVL